MREIPISYQTLDEIAGWASGYGAKILSPPSFEHPNRRFMGHMSFDALLGALAVRLQVVVDVDQQRRIERNHNFQRVKKRHVRNGASRRQAKSSVSPAAPRC
jgi:hypothetical protein